MKPDRYSTLTSVKISPVRLPKLIPRNNSPRLIHRFAGHTVRDHRLVQTDLTHQSKSHRQDWVSVVDHAIEARAAHATNAFVPVEQFRWKRGQDKIVNYDLPEAERFGNAFCGNCGSSLPRESGNSGMLNVPAGSLDCAPGVEARGHIFVGSSAPWFDVSDELPQWDKMPT